MTAAMAGSGQCDEGLIPVPGGRVHWRRFGRGPGPPVLMIHGGPGLTSRYLDPLAGLADGRPVFTWDQLDCGRSDCPHDPALWVLERFVDELDAVRNALTPGPVHVVGHSWGATLAVEWLVTRRPSNVASVVFASPCLDVPRWIRDTRELIAGLSPEAQSAIATAERTGCFTTPDYQRAVWDEWMRAHIMRTLSLEATATVIEAMVAWNANLELLEFMWGPSDFTVTGSLRAFDRTADLRSLDMPALFQCGEFDEARPETVREQAALVPQGKFVMVRGSGHLTMIDAPEETNRAIRDFLERVDSACRAATCDVEYVVMNCSNCGAAMNLVASRRYFQCGHCGAYHFPETVAADGVRIVGQLPDAPNCPACAIAMAHALLDDEHPIDFCATCRGILLPRTSFALVTQKRRAWATSPPAVPSPLNREELRRQLACPKCGRTFATYPHSGPGNVVIDNCASCDVIWLDFGEMRQIVDAPGHDRGSREIHRLDDQYVRRGDGNGVDAEEEERRERDPLRVLADALFG